MPSRLRLLSLPLVVLLAACAAPHPGALPVRVLSVEAPRVEESHESADPAPELAPAPRIGAPGGSGAGSRRVQPVTRAQSGNETVGALPVGIGGSTGPLG